jgi:PAS domain S-box-containing protein
MGVPPAFGDVDGLGPEELRQRLVSLQAIFSRAPVPIAIAHDAECRFVSGNAALVTLLGVSPTTNLSMTPPDGVGAAYRIQRGGVDLPTAELPMQYAIANRCSVRNEIEILRGDGRLLYVQNDVEPLFDVRGQIYGCVSVCVDITARKLAEMALRDADRKKDEFLATLSHELRNPLAPLRTALEVLRLAHDDPSLAAKAHATMGRQLQQLVRITDDLLDVARITRNIVELRRERTDLGTAVQTAVEATKPQIDALGQTLTVVLPSRPVWMDADPTRLAQVFSNLLNNASKYTEAGGRIRVVVSLDHQQATVTVEDTGVGIPSEMLPRVFDMFTQLQEHRDRTQGGLGIGLTLARRLVELHGGAISVSSEGPGRGSRFTVQLPLADVPGTDRAADAREQRPPRSACRVLVADDNPDTAEMMRIMLGLGGHVVRVASDGQQAVEIARQFAPHIAFLDIGMPRMDGYEAARLIRDLGAPITLVALTGWGQDEDKERSREAGFDHHLTKPPDPDVLERLIASCGAG